MAKFNRSLPLLMLLAALSGGVYLLASRFTYRIGFPLDDAWIHQTYARNLAWHGEWSYVLGQPSAGSTSPLWSALLAIGHRLGLGPYGWTFGLGWLLLAAIGWTGLRAWASLCPSRPKGALAAGLFLVFEWHLVWSAGSGMETLLYAVLVLLVLVSLLGEQPQPFKLGLLIGVCLWVRPDGITLLGPVGLVVWLRSVSYRQRATRLGTMLLGATLLALPYLAFNHALSGDWLPNTFFAKQAEYASLQQIPFWRRLGAEALLPLVGAGVLLLPGFIFLLKKAWERREWGVWAGALWFAGYLVLYAWRLPVTYQHGRYIIPAMPVYFLWGLAGTGLLVQWNAAGLWRRVLEKSWVVSIGLVLVAFWLLGARFYARDVAFIESEMVDTASWLVDHTAADTLVAAHDIGALGYFARRPLLDLAGLISPQVIPFMRDERQLAEFLDEQKAQLLVTFPDWYPQLVASLQPVYQSAGNFSLEMGGENMAVYDWPAR